MGGGGGGVIDLEKMMKILDVLFFAFVVMFLKIIRFSFRD